MSFRLTPMKPIAPRSRNSPARARWRLGFGTPAWTRCLPFRFEPGGDDNQDAEFAELARGIVTGGQDGNAGLGSGVPVAT